MSRATGVATAGLRTMLALLVGGLVGAVVAQLLPSLIAASGGAPSSAVLALACAVAVAVLLSSVGQDWAPSARLVRPTSADEAAPYLAGRVADPHHHPLRPRAPGQA